MKLSVSSLRNAEQGRIQNLGKVKGVRQRVWGRSPGAKPQWGYLEEKLMIFFQIILQ